MMRRPWPASRADWDRTRDRVLRRDGHLCSVTGCPAVLLQVDHVVERQDGGTDEEKNLRVLCLRHHLLRHRRPEGPLAQAWRALVQATTVNTINQE